MTAAQMSVHIKRVFKAPRAKVFEAWTKPKFIEKWFGPDELMITKADMDVRAGGAYRIEMKGKVRGEPREGAGIGRYEKIIPNELLVFTWTWSAYPMPETLVTVEFKDVPGGTQLTLTHERFADTETRGNYEGGWTDTLGKLATLVEA